MDYRKYNATTKAIFAPSGFPFDVSDPHAVQSSLGIKADGFLGPKSIQAIAEGYNVKQPNGLYIGPKCIPTEATTATFVDDFTLGDTVVRTRKEKVRQIVIHYDVAYSARHAEQILQNRGYSTHFCIDHDGTIIQCHNPATKVALHAGPPNEYSIGIDLNNPADPKYAETDRKKNGRKREVVRSKIHGGYVDRLDYWPEQIEALQELLEILCTEFGIPKTYPKTKEGEPYKTVYPDRATFNGVLGHYHWSKRKTDPAPLDWTKVFK